MSRRDGLFLRLTYVVPFSVVSHGVLSLLLLLGVSLVSSASASPSNKPDSKSARTAGTGSAPSSVLQLNSKAYLHALVKAARARHLSKKRGWRRLVHYRSGLFGTVSEADGDAFFLSRDGKRNPEAELLATLRSFFTAAKPPPNAPEDWQHPMCRFPARLLWLVQELSIEPHRLPEVTCPRFAEYLSLLEPQSLTLVFSSYYLNNPASTFGHTFLRVNKAGDARSGKRQQLLDYGIDYSANVDTNNPILYAFKGLFGLFPGSFRRIPYFYKVREYNDFESRDIWEYQLNLTQREVRFVVAHLWELGSTYFAYYYLTENCSYHVLGALEAARPSFRS